MNPTTRKLQKVGGGTFTVSVPKDWAVEQGLDAGAPVDIFPDSDGSLVVQRADHGAASLSEIVIEVDHADAPKRTLADSLRTAYITGYETITLTTTDRFTPDKRRDFRRAAARFNGLEVVTETATELTVADVFDLDAISIEQTLTRLQFIALSRLRRAVAGFAGPTPPGGTDETGDARRLAARAVRYSNRAVVDPSARGYLDADVATLSDYRDVGRDLDKVAGHAKRLAALEIDSNTLAGTELEDALSSAGATIVSLLDESTTAVLGDSTRAVARATTARTHHETLHEHLQCIDDANTNPSTPGYLLGAAHTYLDTIANHGLSIAATAHRAALRKDRPIAHERW